VSTNVIPSDDERSEEESRDLAWFRFLDSLAFGSVARNDSKNSSAAVACGDLRMTV